MLKLYQFPAPWDVCSASPFCAKLEAFLRWQKIPYESIIRHDMRGAPKGKLPFIENENGLLGDSSLIIDYLTNKHHLNPDAGLSPEQKAVARSIKYMCEESLYWALLYMRWIDADGWAVLQKDFFGQLPFPMRPFLEWKIKSRIEKQLYMQGMGRHSREEVISIACGDLKALSEVLGGKYYFFGNDMTTIDLVVFAFNINLLAKPFSNPVKECLQGLPNLVTHVQRVREVCFGESFTPAHKKAA